MPCKIGQNVSFLFWLVLCIVLGMIGNRYKVSNENERERERVREDRQKVKTQKDKEEKEEQLNLNKKRKCQNTHTLCRYGWFAFDLLSG